MNKTLGVILLLMVFSMSLSASLLGKLGAKSGKVAIKVKAIALDEENNGKIFYLRTGNLRGRKDFFNTPYFKYIGNDWKAISFNMSAPIKELMNAFEIIDEDVLEMSRKDAIKALGYDVPEY